MTTEDRKVAWNLLQIPIQNCIRSISDNVSIYTEQKKTEIAGYFISPYENRRLDDVINFNNRRMYSIQNILWIYL